MAETTQTPTKISYCVSLQAKSERVTQAVRWAKLLGEQHAGFLEPVLLHSHHSGVKCGSDGAWGQCGVLDPVSGEVTPYGEAPAHPSADPSA